MATVRISKKFTINMGPGTFESYAPEFSVELQDVDVKEDLEQTFKDIEFLVDEAAYRDLSEAAQITTMKDTFILTWLHNRKSIHGRVN